MIENNNILFKCFFVVLAIALSVILLTPRAYAFTIYEKYGPSIVNGPFYDSNRDEYVIELLHRNNGGNYQTHVKKTMFRYYGDDSTFTNVHTEKTNIAEQEGFSMYTYNFTNCLGYYEIFFYNFRDELTGYVKFNSTEIQNNRCDSGNRDDVGIEDDRVGSGCSCIFRSEYWDEYLDAVRDIADRIPPPPNWQQVANTMRDTIVPRMIADLGNLLGTAPPPPPPPPNISIGMIEAPDDLPVDDYAGQLQQSEPEMNDNTELEESVFSASDIINDAPEIEFNEDPTGGFNIMNPLEALPPTTDMPLPGQHAGEWDHQPQQQIIMPTPIPEGAGDVEIGDPPIPNQPNEPAPIPDDNYMPPPTPNNEQVELGNYKPHPEAPDGSG